MKFVAGLAALAVLSAGTAAAQTSSETFDWRLKDVSPRGAIGIGLGPTVDGVQTMATVMVLTEDRPLPGSDGSYRIIELHFEVDCGAGRWRMTGGAYRNGAGGVARRAGGNEWGPLSREGRAQAEVSDVCSGGHTEPVTLEDADPLAALRWLESKIER